MVYDRTRVCFILLLVLADCGYAGQGPKDTQNSRMADLESTARWYLESGRAYQSGDLITRSQLEELQQYLRKTLGNCPATHRGLLNRAVSDTAPLSRFFYREQGSQILRRAAEKLGGYAEIEALSRDRSGRQALKDALSQKTVAPIISAAAARQQDSGTATSERADQEGRKRPAPIYTLEDYLAVATGDKN